MFTGHQEVKLACGGQEVSRSLVSYGKAVVLVGLGKKLVGGLVPVRYRDKAKRLIVRWAVSGGAESFPGLGTSVLDRIDAMCLALDHRIASLEVRLAKLEEALKQSSEKREAS